MEEYKENMELEGSSDEVKHLTKREKKELKKKQKEEERQSKEKKKKTSKLIKYSITTIVIVIIIALVVMWGRNISNQPGEFDDFANCLVENGIKMYGAFWCPKCAEQKQLFGKSFKVFEDEGYIECDERGKNAKPELCDANGITGYPTWIFEDGSRLTGVQPLQSLASKSGCELKRGEI